MIFIYKSLWGFYSLCFNESDGLNLAALISCNKGVLIFDEEMKQAYAFFVCLFVLFSIHIQQRMRRNRLQHKQIWHYSRLTIGKSKNSYLMSVGVSTCLQHREIVENVTWIPGVELTVLHVLQNTYKNIIIMHS